MSISKERGKTYTEGRPIGNLVINTTLNDAGVNKGITYQKQSKDCPHSDKSNRPRIQSNGRRIDSQQEKVEVSNELSIQEKIVNEYRKSYEKQVEQYGEGSEQAQKYAQRLNTQIQSYHSLQGSLRRAQVQYEQLEQAQREAGKSADSLSDSQKDIGEATETAKGKVGKFSSFIEVYWSGR